MVLTFISAFCWTHTFKSVLRKQFYLGVFTLPPRCDVTDDSDRLQDETSRVEDTVSEPAAVERLVDCFVNAKANSFENLLDPLIKIFRLSSLIITAVSASPKFIKKLVDRLNHNKAVLRLHLP